MTKHFFRSLEVKPSEDTYTIPVVPLTEVEEEPVEEEVEEGKSIEELRAERDAFEAEFEALKLQREAELNAQAEEIINNAKEQAFAIVKEKNDEAQVIRMNAEDDARNILEKANEEARKIEDGIAEKEKKIISEAREIGYKDGWDEGIAKANGEVERLTERMHDMINGIINKRTSIFIEAEQQIISLVLSIARKVIKVLSENQKNVVINNVIHSLKKLSTRKNIAIRVNLADLELTTQYKDKFIKIAETENIKILEDTTVDKGGCIIETDFGTLDARISSQLHEIEDKIQGMVPLQVQSNEPKEQEK
ncbi:MAG: flagellar assembly protein FliH [Spirochaetota bacterium]|jgi:flagellar assembly protein FliH|nr:flagellar assembly protein FliH [Spirochaetota bacterium]